MRLVDIWELIGSSAERRRSFSIDHDVYYPQVHFTIYLDRKPLFYVVNIIIPVAFLVLVVLMVSVSLVFSYNRVWFMNKYKRVVLPEPQGL